MSLAAILELSEYKEVIVKPMATKEEKYNFSMQIENLANRLNITYLEAIAHHCEETGLEIEVAATLVNDILKGKLETEAQQLRYLPRQSRLPI